jgi:N-acetylglucosaminyldiphosphoundecaprenol N-acetyl-beta-D-mannosaminyltransferase
MYPGYGSVDDLSDDDAIDAINASHADFLVVSLGAAKGQAWLLRNQSRLRVPVRAHLGAAINFLAGTVKRAPRTVQRLGLEWLWRIKEEPKLWRRYWADARTLLRVLLFRVLPLTVKALWRRIAGGTHQLGVKILHSHEAVTVAFAGDATAAHIDLAISRLRDALATGKPVIAIDLSETSAIDARFLGLILMMRKCVYRQGATFTLVGVSSYARQMLRLNEATFLLPAVGSATASRSAA